MNDMLRSRFPKGPAWNFDPEGQFSKIIDTAENEILPEIVAIGKASGSIRNPWNCQDYNTLALDFGAQLFKGGDLESYRKYLSSVVSKIIRTGSDTDIQTVLTTAGFIGATVTTNHNCNDLRSLIRTRRKMVCGSRGAVCGNTLAVTGENGYIVLANGNAIDNYGNPVGYPIPNNPEEWGYIILISGGVTKDIDGNITAVSLLEINEDFYSIFKTLILRTKPLHAICILAVQTVTSGIIAQTGNPDLPTIAQTGSTTIPIIAQGV